MLKLVHKMKKKNSARHIMATCSLLLVYKTHQQNSVGARTYPIQFQINLKLLYSEEYTTS